MTTTVHTSQPRGAVPSLGHRWLKALDPDFLFPAIVFGTAVFVLFLPGVAPLVYLGAAGLWFVLWPNRLGALARCWAPLLLGGYALLSIAWSTAPSSTLYYGIQYLITILLGCQIGSSLRERPLLLGLFTPFFLFGLFNFWVGWSEGMVTLWGFYSHVPFTGVMASKNTQADIAALSTMLALTVGMEARRSRSWLLLGAAALLVVLNLLLIANAQSAGAVVAVLVGSSVIVALSLTRVLSVQARFAALILTLIVAAVLLFTSPIWVEPLFNNVLRVAGKDTTLTGRTYIWERAEVAIQSRPLLGTGFGAYWRIGSLEAEAIWRRLLIPGRSGFNFHNTIYEIRVHMGMVGLILFAAVVLPLIARLFLKTVRQPSPMSVFFTALVVYEASRMNFESIGVAVFQYATYLQFAALAWSTRPDAPQAAVVGPSSRERDRRSERWRS